MFFQCIKDSRRISIFEAGIKRYVQHFFCCVFCVVGVELFQLFHTGIGDGAGLPPGN